MPIISTDASEDKSPGFSIVKIRIDVFNFKSIYCIAYKWTSIKEMAKQFPVRNTCFTNYTEST